MRLLDKFFIVVYLVTIYSCSIDLPEEGEYLKWSTILEIPLIKDEITLETLAEDSLILVENLENYFQDGATLDSIFVYRKQIEIEKVEVGNKLEIDPISTSFNQNIDDVTVASVGENVFSTIGIISLDDIEPSSTDPYIFSDIYPDILDVPDGETVAIPAFEIAPIIKPFSFDDFGYAEFSGGILELTIINNMVVPLGPPILITLRQVSFNDTIDIPGATIQFDDLINANDDSATGTIDLSGVTMPGEILVQVSGNSQGTSGIPILINEDARNSNFTIVIGGESMEVTSATAKVPEQLIEETGIINLEPDSNKVVRAKIDSGNLIIEVDNYIVLSSVLDISIPNLEDPSGNTFSSSINISGNTINIVDETNMNNYSLVMEPDNQSINYNYNVLTVDSGDELIPVTSNDSITVQITLEGSQSGSDITFSEFQGFLSQDAMVDSNTINLETATKVDQATLNSGELKLSIVNNIGIDAVVNFSIVEFTKNEEILDTSFAISSNPSAVSVDLTGYVLDLDLDSDPQIVHYISTIDIPSDELMSLTFGQSISINVNLDSLSFFKISGYVDPVVVEIDTIEQNVDLPAELNDLDFSIINMDFSFQSSIELPVLLTLDLTSFNDETGENFTKIIDNINITQTPQFSIDSVEQLINIKPNRILASGNATVGSLDDFGSVSVSDTLSGILTIAAPLAFEIDNESKIELDPEQFEAVSVDDFINAKVFFDYENSLELGANVVLLMASDTTYFDNGLSDTLTQLTIEASNTGLDSISLEESSFDLLAREGNYSKAVLHLLGRDDGPTRFLSTDTMKFSIYLSTEVIVNLNPEE